MISQISSHEFSGSFWETPSGEKQHKSGKSAWREGLCSGTKRLCGGRRRVSSPGPVFVEDKAKKGETEKSPSKASRVVDWAGEEKG